MRDWIWTGIRPYFLHPLVARHQRVLSPSLQTGYTENPKIPHPFDFCESEAHSATTHLCHPLVFSLSRPRLLPEKTQDLPRLHNLSSLCPNPRFRFRPLRGNLFQLSRLCCKRGRVLTSRAAAAAATPMRRGTRDSSEPDGRTARGSRARRRGGCPRLPRRGNMARVVADVAVVDAVALPMESSGMILASNSKIVLHI